VPNTIGKTVLKVRVKAADWLANVVLVLLGLQPQQGGASWSSSARPAPKNMAASRIDAPGIDCGPNIRRANRTRQARTHPAALEAFEMTIEADSCFVRLGYMMISPPRPGLEREIELSP